MNNFDIYIAYIPWGNSGKTRPVLVYEIRKTVVIVFRITTQYANKSEFIRRKYFKIDEWQEAGLTKQSYVDTIAARSISPIALKGKYKIGKLTKFDKVRFILFTRKNTSHGRPN